MRTLRDRGPSDRYTIARKPRRQNSPIRIAAIFLARPSGSNPASPWRGFLLAPCTKDRCAALAPLASFEASGGLSAGWSWSACAKLAAQQPIDPVLPKQDGAFLRSRRRFTQPGSVPAGGFRRTRRAADAVDAPATAEAADRHPDPDACVPRGYIPPSAIAREVVAATICDAVARASFGRFREGLRGCRRPARQHRCPASAWLVRSRMFAHPMPNPTGFPASARSLNRHPQRPRGESRMQDDPPTCLQKQVRRVNAHVPFSSPLLRNQCPSKGRDIGPQFVALAARNTEPGHPGEGRFRDAGCVVKPMP